MCNFHTWTENQAPSANITPCIKYLTINKNSTKHTHLLDKTNFKGMLPGLKTTKLL